MSRMHDSGRRRARDDAGTGVRGPRAARVAALVALLLLAAGGSAVSPASAGLAAPPAAPASRPCALRATPGVPMSEGFPLAPSSDYAHSTGDVRALVLFIDFPDAPAAESAPARYAEFFPAVQQWYARASYGRLRYHAVPVLRYFRMPRPFSSYGIERGYGWPVHRAMMRDLVKVVGHAVDFRGYNMVNVIATPNAGPPADETVLSVTWTGGNAATTADGTRLDRVSVIYGHDQAGYRVLVHENGHLLGLPDLYSVSDFRRTDTLAGQWDSMSLDWGLQGDFFAWHKWRLGWLSDSQVDCVVPAKAAKAAKAAQGRRGQRGQRAADPPGRLYHLAPLETPGGQKAVVVPYGRAAAYVVEVRRSLGNDAQACSQGVLIYRVRTDVDTGDGPISIVNAHPNTNACDYSSGSFNSLNRAPFGTGGRFIDSGAGIEIDVLGKDAAGGWTVQVKRG
ncbi:M6 family metalloprotease domain-containing protein [Streptomyces sp. RB6PN25]|uniref:M6 family metalloprotease domain-containing protein n=1 Tax=Streptomyces humicola TaxID=2953240 RepID=A0ABT1Q2C4_9ACTN|nr:M6 family metalloprotease domain-containing protein [Streptomyces humicola]MCQ4082882.1 M6 family metalloprotease domain-containing protein [Streptomyces humicola]